MKALGIILLSVLTTLVQCFDASGAFADCRCPRRVLLLSQQERFKRHGLSASAQIILMVLNCSRCSEPLFTRVRCTFHQRIVGAITVMP